MTALTPSEITEAAVVEVVARAMEAACTDDATWQTLAADAVAAYRATQDGGAEEVVRRVEALADELDDRARDRSSDARTRIAHAMDADRIRAALAPQAGDGVR